MTLVATVARARPVDGARLIGWCVLDCAIRWCPGGDVKQRWRCCGGSGNSSTVGCRIRVRDLASVAAVFRQRHAASTPIKRPHQHLILFYFNCYLRQLLLADDRLQRCILSESGRPASSEFHPPSLHRMSCSWWRRSR